MSNMVLFWQIVPTDDGCRYLYKDKDGRYQLRYKSDGLPDNDFLLFNTEEEANAYINANLYPMTYKAEWIAISESRLSEWKRENSIRSKDAPDQTINNFAQSDT